MSFQFPVSSSRLPVPGHRFFHSLIPRFANSLIFLLLFLSTGYLSAQTSSKQKKEQLQQQMKKLQEEIKMIESAIKNTSAKKQKSMSEILSLQAKIRSR